ncbi:hypothetical protein ATL39_3266 [Sinobaca qinghaiensis]|uniref:Uncharacterized protein n=1 Tax=Sinobaca qinghaiensis TaxID=342944 RepID=A0A419UW56_9BACL|nr:hypothetical protein [Sinobaca qinghaiensis]RKD68803.1 hypothetical protein ATL39_3266 [Sinobaca qinghaiensis]
MEYGMNQYQMATINQASNQAKILKGINMQLAMQQIEAINRFKSQFAGINTELIKSLTQPHRELIAMVARQARIRRETFAALQRSLVPKYSVMATIPRMETVTPKKVNMFQSTYYRLIDVLQSEPVKKFFTISDKVINVINFLFRMNEAAENISSMELQIIGEFFKSLGSWLWKLFTS